MPWIHDVYMYIYIYISNTIMSINYKSVESTEFEAKVDSRCQGRNQPSSEVPIRVDFAEDKPLAA